MIQNCYLFRTDFFKNPVTAILPVILYGCGTWSLTLREEQRLMAVENKVQRRIFGRKRDEITGEWRKIHNEELNDLYSPSIVQVIKSRRMKWASAVARVGDSGGACRVLVGGTREKDLLGDPLIGGSIILKWILRKWHVGAWTGSVWLRTGTGVGLL